MINGIIAIIKSKWPLILVIIWLAIGVLMLGIGQGWYLTNLACLSNLAEDFTLAGIATWVLAGGVFFAFWQIREARKSTNAQIAVGLFEKFRSPKLKETLRNIIYSHSKIYLRYPSNIERKGIEEVIDWFDMLGALVKKDIINKSLAIEVFAGPPALRCWYQLVLYIRETQDERGFYCDYYEDFARRTLDHFDNKVEVFLQLDWEKKKIPLVKTLKQLVKSQKNKAWKEKLYPRDLKEINKDRKKERNDKIGKA